MYFFLFFLCVHTIASIIKTNVFFDFADFQVDDRDEDGKTFAYVKYLLYMLVVLVV